MTHPPTTHQPGRIGHRQLQTVANQLDDIDHQLLSLLSTHRYVTTNQLAQMISIDHHYATARSALRQTNRRLTRHHALGLADHLTRRIGGTRAGSTGYIWYLREPGHRLVNPSNTRRRHHAPSHIFLAHTLAVTQARITIEQAIHSTGGGLSRLRTEPDCLHTWTSLGGGTRWLKPDLEAITTSPDGGAEDH